MENFEPDQCSFQRNQSLSQICCNDGAAVGQRGLSIFRSRPLAVLAGRVAGESLA